MSASTTIIADRYELGELLGRGGMGEVWAAQDLRLKRDVAVKLLNPETAAEPEVRERFDAEARAAANLSHANVVLVFDTGEHEGRPYLVMERLPGRTLADEIAGGPLSPERARAVGTDVLAALGAAHAAGILHRDIKPANVLLAPDGSVKVVDFGIAKTSFGRHLTTEGIVLGTPGYLAPERLTGEPASVRSDLYSVGVLLYEALAGREPFASESLRSLALAIPEGRALPLGDVRPGIPEELVKAVRRAMDPDPGRRFASAAEMAEALVDRPPAEKATEALPLRATERLSLPKLGPRWRVTAPLAVVAIAVVALIVASTSGSPGSRNPATTTVPARPLPAAGDAVPAGRYLTTSFKPGLSFTLGDGWTASGPEARDLLALRRTGVELSLLTVSRVFAADQRPAAARDYLAPGLALPSGGLPEFLRRHPRLRVTSPAPTRIGGIAAVRVDVEVADPYGSEACTEPCVVLFQLDAEPATYRVVKLQQGRKMRLYVVDGGGPVLSIVAAPDRFDASVAVAEAVVRSIALPG